MSFGADMLALTRNTMDGYAGVVYGDLMGSWPARIVVTLYVVFIGYAVLMGYAKEKSKQWATSIILLLVIQAVTFNQAAFSEWVATPVFETAFKLSALATGKGDTGLTDTFEALDENLGSVMHTIDNLEPEGNVLTNTWVYIKVGVASAVLSLVFALMYLAFLGLFLLAVFAIYLLLIVGGAFLWLGSFAETRGLAWAWVRAVANYVLWMFFLSTVMGAFMWGVTALTKDLANWDIARDGVFTATYGRTLFFSAMCAFFLMKTSDLASALTGGSSMQPGIVTTAVNVASMGLSGIARPGGMGGAAMQMGMTGMKGAGRQIMGGAARAYSAMRGIK